MAVTTCDSKNYDKMAKDVSSDAHLGKHFGKKAPYADEVQGAAMPKSMTSGRNGGKADRNMTPSPTIKAEKYGK